MSATSLPRLPADFRPAGLRGQRVLVLGLGSFGGGLGAASHLRREGADVTVADLRSAEDLAEPIRELEAMSSQGGMATQGDSPIAYILGRHPSEQEVAAADWIVASPAVKWSAPPLVLAAKRGIPVESEITLLLRLLPCPWLGITGTNGKSTTTMLASHCLAAEGRRVWSGGNLGGSLLHAWREMRAEDVAVLEISSFQLEHMAEIGLGPTVGLVTNVTPDHLDRHGTFEAYAAAKRAILARAKTAVLRRGDPVCERFAQECEQRGVPVLWFGEAGARLLDESTASFRDEEGREVEVDLAPFPLRGAHNRLNLLAAAAAATRFGVPFAAAIRAAFAAKPLERRLNEVARVQEVLFVDDSVSTSPPAVAAALGAFPGRSRLLAGGYDKGIDPAPLIAAILARGPEEGAGGCLKAYLYGAVGPALAARLERAVAQKTVRAGRGSDVESECAKWEVFVDLRSAFAAAAREAQPGDTVLFSPGYASYDQFRNFTERGDLFRALVSQIATH